MSGREEDTMGNASSDDGSDVLAPVWTAEGHLDEGTIHTWLDGAFDAAPAAAIEAHVLACAVCAANVAEARGLIAGASRMIRALDVAPSGVVPSEDAARTASRIIAAAAMLPAIPDAAKDEGAGTALGSVAAQSPRVPAGASDVRAVRPRRAWYSRPEWRVAAAVVLMAGGGAYVWSRSTPEVAFSTVSSDRPVVSGDSTQKAGLVSPGDVASDARAAVARSVPAAAARASELPAPEGAASKAAPDALPVSSRATSATQPSAPVRELAVAAPPAAAGAAASVENRRDLASATAESRRAESAKADAPRAAGGVALGFTSSDAARRRTVTGRVVTPTDVPLEGASVVVQGTTLSVETNPRGEFVLRGVPDSTTLLVRRLGYEATRVTLPTFNADSLYTRVTLQASMTTLSAVTVQSSPPAPLERRVAVSEGLVNRAGLECWSLTTALPSGGNETVGTPPPALMMTSNLGSAAEVTTQWVNWPMIGSETRVVMRRTQSGAYRGTGIAPGVQWTLELTRQGTGWGASATGVAAGDGARATPLSTRLTLSVVDLDLCRR